MTGFNGSYSLTHVSLFPDSGILKIGHRYIVQTSLNQINPVEYELEIDATADELAPQIKKRLREHQATITMKGFRQGKVPINLLKKMYGESLVIDVIEKSVMEVFQDEVLDPGEHTVLGSPVLDTLDYKLDGDLHAVLKFGVKPEITLQDLSETKLIRLVHDVSEDEINKEIEAILKKEADLKTREEGSIDATDHVVIDMQRMDKETATPVIGERDENLTFFLDDEQLRDALRDALIGKKEGDTFKVNLPIEEAPSEQKPDTPSSDLLILPTDSESDNAEFEMYEVHIKEVKERLDPELDEEFIKEITKEEAENEEGLREFIKTRLTSSWKEESRRLLEGELISSVLELHTFPVPASAVEVFLNSFVSELRERSNNNLPENFDIEAFKEMRRDDAERLARWQLIRDHVVDSESLEVTDNDRKAYFIKLGGNEETAASLLSYYASSGNQLLERIDQELLNSKVIDMLAERFSVEEKNKEDYMEILKERQASREALEI